MGLLPDEVVRLCGLQARGGALNGQLGVVVGKQALAEQEQDRPPEPLREPRWEVRIMGADSKLIAVRQCNFRTARAEPVWLRQALGAAASLSVLAGAAGYAAGAGTASSGLPPIASMLWYLSTLVVCYWLHAPLLAEGVVVPAISEMGVSRGARLVYRVGFGLCGLLLAVTVMQLRLLALAQPPLEDGAEGSAAANSQQPPALPGIVWGLVAAGGVALQGVCTLRVDFGLETAVHLGGAMLAMIGTMQHAAVSNLWFGALPAASPLRQTGLRSWGLWLRRDAMQQVLASGGANWIFVLFLVPLGLQLAGRLGKGSAGSATENGMGLMQWAIVAGIAGFFFSYTFDLMAP